MIAISVFSNSFVHALYISSAVVTCTCLIPFSETDNWEGPIIKVTLAPLLYNSFARATPIFPEEWLPIKRTGSNGSYVGPAETNAFLPFNDLGKKKFSFKKSIISSGSAMRPSPYNPLANSPLPTGIILFPNDSIFLRLSDVDGWCHMSSSMAGATITGHVADK